MTDRITDRAVAPETRDFFISRAGKSDEWDISDKEIGRAIDEILQAEGYTTWLQDTDFGHASFMAKMADGFTMVENGTRVLALVSRRYFASDYCLKEARYPLIDDSNNDRERLIVLRVEDCRIEDFLKDLRHIDLVPVLHDRAQLRAAVLGAIDPIRFPAEEKVAQFQMRTGRQILHPAIRAAPSFTGRDEEFAVLEETLWRSEVPRSATALRGLGGVGKSVLAQEYAWRNRARYHGVWWVRAEKTETLLDDLIELGAKLISGLDKITDRHAAAQMMLDHIAQSDHTRPWLIVYDNVPAPDTIRRLTPASNTHVLITTRWADWYGEADELTVAVFSPEIAVNFLMERVRGSAQRPEETRREAQILANDLGCLPLALAIARAQAWGMNWTLSQYRAHVGELLQRKPTRAVEYPHSVAATFSLALDEVLKTAPEAEKLMAIAAFLAPEDIPLDVITDDAMPEIVKGDAVAALSETSLITPGQLSDGTPSFSVHRLVQAAMRDRLGEHGEAACRLAKRLVIALWPEGNKGADPKYWPQIARLLSHAQAILTHADGPDGSDHPALLLSLVAHHLHARAHYGEAEILLRRALTIDKESYGPEHPNVAIRLNNLATLLQDTNRLTEAEPLYRRALSIDEVSYGPQHPNVAIRLNNLANLLHNTNRLAEAELMMRRALTISKACYAPEHPDLAIPLRGLKPGRTKSCAKPTRY